MDQDEITARVYHVIKNNPDLTMPQIMDKLITSLPSVPLSRILISINHLRDG